MTRTEPDLKRLRLGKTDVTSTTEAERDENGREEQRGTVNVNVRSKTQDKIKKKKESARSE